MSKPLSTPELESRGNGTAYGRPPPHSDDLLVRVGPYTPCGEYLRRYWHPLALSSDATASPRKVRILGEDLILFRDGKGRPGLLYPRCMHRGTTLYYGHIENRGIRCCYHGWLFDVEGNCLEQPCEPNGGVGRASARQPWYPVEERYGIVFAYLGPKDKMPLLPRYDIFENLKEGESIYVHSAAGTAYGDHKVQAETVPYNWLQAWENTMDPYHVWVLHSTFSGLQFAEGFKVMPKVQFEDHKVGVVYHAYRDFEDGRSMDRTSFTILPCAAAFPSIELTPGKSNVVVWFRPVDDRSFLPFIAEVRTKPMGSLAIPMTPDGKTWSEMTEEEHQKFPGDFEAQSGQGEINLHSDEHLVKSDAGVAKLRRMMKQQIKIVQEGGDPAGTAFKPGEEIIEIVSGNFFKK